MERNEPFSIHALQHDITINGTKGAIVDEVLSRKLSVQGISACPMLGDGGELEIYVSLGSGAKGASHALWRGSTVVHLFPLCNSLYISVRRITICM